MKRTEERVRPSRHEILYVNLIHTAVAPPVEPPTAYSRCFSCCDTDARLFVDGDWHLPILPFDFRRGANSSGLESHPSRGPGLGLLLLLRGSP